MDALPRVTVTEDFGPGLSVSRTLVALDDVLDALQVDPAGPGSPRR